MQASVKADGGMIRIQGEYFTVSNGYTSKANGTAEFAASAVLAVECVKRRNKRILYVTLLLAGIGFAISSAVDLFANGMYVFAAFSVPVCVFGALYLLSGRKYAEFTTTRGIFRVLIPPGDTQTEHLIHQLQSGTYESTPKMHGVAQTAPPEIADSGYDIFISHSSKDKQVADAIVHYLEARKLRCWVAPRDIDPSMEWAESIVNGIKKCRVFLLIFSSNSLQSKQVLREVNQALDANLPVLPFRIENVLPSGSFSYYLGGIHWLDAIGGNWEQHVQNLYVAVAKLTRD